MILHSVMVTRNRLEMTKRAVETYLDTVTVPHTFLVVDNASTDGTQQWLLDNDVPVVQLAVNRYPGFACNLGWALLPSDAGFLHRADNDFTFLPGWCDEVWQGFQDPAVGQLGLIPFEHEPCETNVGGNNVIRRELWDAGLRYDETPWPEYPPGYSEDTFFSPAVKKLGWKWARVSKQVIQDMSEPHWDDEYSRESYQARNIGHRLRHAKEV